MGMHLESTPWLIEHEGAGMSTSLPGLLAVTDTTLVARGFTGHSMAGVIALMRSMRQSMWHQQRILLLPGGGDDVVGVLATGYSQ